MGKDKRYKRAARDAGGFVAIPWVVLDSPAYLALSVHAKALLMDVARQLAGNNNGMLLCSRAKLAPRGWTSNDMLTKAKRELMAAGFLFQTVMGQRPNKAAWYAVTWLALDRIDGYDAGAAAMFVRSAYQLGAPLIAARLQMPPAVTGICQPKRIAEPLRKTQPLHRVAVQEAP